MKERLVVLGNRTVRLGFVLDRAMTGLFDRLVCFLDPIFSIADSAGAVDFTVELRRFAAFPAELVPRDGEELVIRRSSAKPFNFAVRRGTDAGGAPVALDEKHHTAYRIDRERRRIVLFASGDSFFHLIELVRYTALLCEEARGTLVLHASAAMSGDGAVLVLGHRGQGKTTTLLQLLLARGLSYLSGDKVLISRTDDGIVLRGWPDYPHVGIATLRTFPVIADRCGISLVDGAGRPRSDQEKVLIEPARYWHGLGAPLVRESARVRALIFPDVAARPPICRLVPRSERGLAAIETHVETAKNLAPARWHGVVDDRACNMPPPDRSMLEPLLAADWFELRGGADVTLQ